MTTTSLAQNTNSNRGHLVIIGGGLRPDNAPVFQTLVQLAGGPDKARFVILPTASYSIQDSQYFEKELHLYGVGADRTEVLDVTEHNASTSTSDPAMLERVRRATGVYLSGGDQRRLVKALTKPDGSDTPLLAEIRKFYLNGGVIAGSSAGASAQSQTMLAVSGLPDRLIDEGFDTLDYGITSDSRQRGLLLRKGFGFFEAGIIDQHFYSFRGRLGRLTRAVDESKVPYGFGIEENTALIVQPDGLCRVQGRGMVTIIKTSKQFRGEDGPTGYAIAHVWLSALSDGDTFDPATMEITVAPEKQIVTRDKAEYNGNFLVSDIGSGPSARFTLLNGLAENAKPYVSGVMLKYHPDWVHGYHYKLSRVQNSPVYAGIMNSEWTYSLLNLNLEIRPIGSGLKPAHEFVPQDNAQDAALARAINAVSFRGLVVPNAQGQFRPSDRMTRGELAAAVARSTHLQFANVGDVNIADVVFTTPEGEEIYKAVAHGFIGLDEKQRFRSEEPVTSDQAVHALRKLALLDRDELEEDLKSELGTLESLDEKPVSRQSVALLLAKILRLVR